MTMKRQKWRDAFLIGIVLGPLFLCSCAKKSALERIREAGHITVATRNNAHCYYIYRDEPMGFEYDLAKAFSEYLGVKLKVITPHWERLIDVVSKGKADFIAASLTITPSREQLVDFSDEYLAIQQLALIHKRNSQITKLEDLEGNTIHVRRATSYEERLHELKGEGLDLTIEPHVDVPTEELIRMVAEKEIEVTIADSHIALLNRRYYPDVQIAFPIEEQQSLGWAVKKGEASLKNEINVFFKKIKKDGTFAKIYEKYFANVEIFDYVDLKKYHQRLTTRLPRYKDTIKNAAQKHGFDWRLIAAAIYQESHFNPRAVSYTGVRGMMQLTLKTANDMGIKNRLDPTQSIMGGVKYLKKLYERYKDAKEPDRLLIALASYNVGHGHILDAQEIARQRDLDPNSWSSLEQILPLLRYPKYYKKTKNGYCRGTEAVRYVNRILTYYDILKREAIS
ncbi:MAG: membrane-bound lytic murein transglycosylase MltF [Deltaproteobacteria bacterium]|nr:membrane-bound lytic murein transglycosylase MltF [Deltaproteobacteria bacterium]MBW2077255.1 membrane-bound lytic murein transglycosylase MltF [Deltaproteobacteria bacterium]MBW2311021.1 membrane-bound lytic murein transglycosylase MltF [Deltaproteobacteria bacterium]RLB29597.1 MAG: membrane-bound lytic murein transglycosylase MltF [Deltaproteobacteria bacterium]